MQILRDVSSIKNCVMQFRKDGYKIGLVPTMGALHDGHLSLVNVIKKEVDKVILSIFVNPLQFSFGEDYESYPRNDIQDCEKCKKVAVDVVYLPVSDVMYPSGFSSTVSVGPLSRELCGASRKNYFDGIMTVLLKLVMQTETEYMILGEKDYQMLFLARKLFQDLNISTKILKGNTVRDDNGLALSSRHQYLNAEEKHKAHYIYHALVDIAHRLKNEPYELHNIIEDSKQSFKREGFILDYLQVRDNNSLEEINFFRKPARIFVAAYLGRCRLIDNLLVV
ncbi:pantoate--beta-alanine ligase [Neoehrlichia mikurensis]|uniref:Pantothenate synthetase n=1 Tax=Neoehrlichia mikurensis TaxID=89586 RepID=A0A9Q9C071_9RICK|nr:pantoate--beta-alanine ligase [Neoehrlichia mikurensis]QXK91633.1 pantoate--beta-alanine ligase [Neoehrlichia mikurensis]QXK92844.1 pantoate--beta-alanine ligase [Neoehrlichia mikurensis]QXK93324.1 pantoate--beta-alanine ligase [Neoehrlichia mikurensis]UTO55734.1 pantoate--beta-alanine ligase [Neoehrlichia mikurensis]UTO56651.1 pantoate--beta-alanine ligase [Neoehrlichia mikurensis]